MKMALIGNPNTGKSTVFNKWTGLRQTTGNWPGVTVEQHVGQTKVGTLVDLPGIYSLHAVSQDEQVAAHYAMSNDYDVIVNVVDAVNLERNLYLTLALRELGRPMIVVLSMTDVLKKQGTIIKWSELSKRLGVPVFPSSDLAGAEVAAAHLAGLKQNHPEVIYPPGIERARARVHREGEPFQNATLRLEGILPGAEEVIEAFEKAEGVSPDVIIADARYAAIYHLLDGIVSRVSGRYGSFSMFLDRIVLHRFLGVPIFLGLMYVLFWVTQDFGGCFIDFFDHVGGALFVTAPTQFLTWCHAPDWLILMLATGLGSGLQTVMTFIPPVFFIFLGLSILEDSGYMARAAYVMDRLMRFLGLPGSAFVPMLVGFGCTVPAIMATRTLSTRRDRLISIFMAPFMSCGARLPVYALFGAAFFGDSSENMIFAIYGTGILLAVVTGVLLKHTLFVGAPSSFVMELPMYHFPNPSAIFKTTWGRLSSFVLRAGYVIAIMVLLLSVADNITVGKDDMSLVNAAGRAMTPLFEPMGVEPANWQASVALVTGLFAKEAVVGTLQSLYAQEEATADVAEGAEVEEKATVWGGITDGFVSIGVNVGALLGLVEDGEEDESGTLQRLREKFTHGPHQAFAYLLFILLYVPCLAAVGVIIKEAGRFYGTILCVYLTVLGWSVSTLYYQLTCAHETLWIAVSGGILALIVVTFKLIGNKCKV